MCGYCEPGFIMAIAAMLQASPSPSEEQIAALPNICRCGAYPRIRKAIARAAEASAFQNCVRISGGAQVDLTNLNKRHPKRLSTGTSKKAQIARQRIERH